MLTVRDIVKAYTGERQQDDADQPSRGVLAVDHVSFEVPTGSFFTLLGPSGCGKTTTLRSIAGLERPDAGRIAWENRVLFDQEKKVNVPINSRQLGMVFQSYAIWPHMTVFENVAFPLRSIRRSARPTRGEINQRVTRVLEMVGLGTTAQRAATKLSGGQQQRLALARAVVGEPDLLLLDEPLSNLDAKVREAMRFELRRLQRELNLTVVYVTHDQAEALAMSTRIAVMNEGKLVQLGKPRQIYEEPNSRFVADFIGTNNFVRGVVREVAGDRYRVDTADGAIWAKRTPGVDTGTSVTLAIRPEHIDMSAQLPDLSAENQWLGVVENRAYLGEVVEHVVRVGETTLRIRSSLQSIPRDSKVCLSFDEAVITTVTE